MNSSDNTTSVKAYPTLLLSAKPLVLIYSGPAKSTPVNVKAGSSLTLNSGSGGGGGAD